MDRVSQFATHKRSERLTELGAAGSTEALQNGAQLHGSSHVAANLELALHEGLLGVQLAAHQLLEYVLRHRQRAVSLHHPPRQRHESTLRSLLTLPDEPLVTLPDPFLRSSVHVSLPTFPADNG